jgi:hypothetical protein
LRAVILGDFMLGRKEIQLLGRIIFGFVFMSSNYGSSDCFLSFVIINMVGSLVCDNIYIYIAQ